MDLYPHQQKAIEEASVYPRRAMFWSPRLGKTRAAAIMLAGKRSLIVAPLSVCGAWKDELVLGGAEVYPAYLGSTTRAANALYGRFNGTVVLNYDKLTPLAPVIRSWGPIGVVFDESHLLKNPKSERSKAARKIAKRAEFVRILTGTPSPNHYGDLWAQMTLVNPGAWGATFAPFAQRFLVRDAIYPSKIIAHINVPELQEMLRADADIIRREDVFGPDTYQRIDRWLDLPDAARAIYDNLVKEWVYYHERGEVLADHTLKRLVRLQQLSAGYLRSEKGEDFPIHRTKIEAVLGDLSEVVESGEKAVIFHHFTWEGDQYEEALQSQFPHVLVRRISGATDAPARQATIDLLREADRSVLVVAQTQAAGIGISLAEATHALFVSQSFSFTEEEQAKDRIYKPGARRVLSYYRIRNTVDEFIASVIASKVDVHSAVTHADVREMAYGNIRSK